MLAMDGLVGCAIVDSATGLVLAREMRAEPAVDMDLAAAASAQVLRAHRQAARSMGLGEQVDEVMTSAGPRQQVMRTVLQKRFGKIFKAELPLADIDLPSDLQKAGPLAVTNAAAAHGWLLLTWRRAPARARIADGQTQLALPTK